MEGKGTENTQLGGGEFQVDRQKVKLSLMTNGISWCKGQETVELCWKDVIGCRVGGETNGKPDSSFTLHYAEHQEDNTLRHKHLTFTGNSGVSDVTRIISEQTKGRPTRLLVIINPKAGEGKGEVLYNTVVSPLFQMAQIRTEVIVSQRPEHIEEIGRTFDFTAVDGVVVVGGDGTYSSLINAVLPRQQTEYKVNLDDPSAKLKPFDRPIGILPAGSCNTIVRNHYGCMDTETAALHIITGRKTPKNVSAIYMNGKLYRFGVSIWGNGFWRDLLEHDRVSSGSWTRVPYLFVNIFMKGRREFSVKLDYIPYVTCIEKTEETLSSKPDSEWKTIEDKVTGVYGWPYVMSSREGSDLIHADVNAKGMSLLIEKQCGRMEYFSWLGEMTKDIGTAFNNNHFVSTIHVKAYRLKIIVPGKDEKQEQVKDFNSSMLLDGELAPIDSPEYEVRLHSELLETYGDGIVMLKTQGTEKIPV